MSDLTRKQREIMRKMQDKETMYFYHRTFPYSPYWFFIVKNVNEMVDYKCKDVSKLEDAGLIQIQWFEKPNKMICAIATLTEKGKEWKCDSWWECAKKWFA